MKEKTLARILTISLGAILIIGILIIYKLYLLNEYGTPIDVSYLSNVEEIKIQTVLNSSNSSIKNMDIYLRDNLEKTEMDTNSITYKSDKGVELWITYWSSDIVNEWKEHSDNQEINFDKLAAKENIKNEYDMFNYLIRHYNDKLTIFSGINKIYMYYWSRNSISEIATSQITSASHITGNLTGFYTEGNAFNIARIYHNDTAYIIRFNKNLYTKQEIEQTLSSITFNS